MLSYLIENAAAAAAAAVNPNGIKNVLANVTATGPHNHLVHKRTLNH